MILDLQYALAKKGIAGSWSDLENVPIEEVLYIKDKIIEENKEREAEARSYK